MEKVMRAADGRIVLPFENGERELVAYPQKRLLIRLTARPPQLETPFSVFNEGVLTTAILMYTQMGAFEAAIGLAAVLLGLMLVLAGALTAVQQSGRS